MKPTLGMTLLFVLAGCENSNDAAATHVPARTSETTPPVESAGVDSLPLERGFFVDTGTPCAQASNATLHLHHGTGFGAARGNCDFNRIARTGPNTYSVTQTCTDIHGGSAEPSTVVFEIQNRTAFLAVDRTNDWKYSARHCPQTRLPEPWRSNDISDVMD